MIMLLFKCVQSVPPWSDPQFPTRPLKGGSLESVTTPCDMHESCIRTVICFLCLAFVNSTYLRSHPINRRNCFYFDLYGNANALNHHMVQRVCEKIVLNDDHVGDQKLIELSKSISTSTTMRELYIYKDAFTGTSMISLGSLLSTPSSPLRVVSLVKCNLDDNAMKMLAKNLHLSQKSKLQQFVADDNLLGPKGLLYLDNAISKPKAKIKLSSLYLHKNRMNDQAIPIIGKLLNRAQKSIRSIDLTGNAITTIGYDKLKIKIQKEKNFKLGIDDNNSSISEILKYRK